MNPACVQASRQAPERPARAATAPPGHHPPPSPHARHLSRKMGALPRRLTAVQIGRRAGGPAASGEGAPPCTCIARRPKQHLNRLLTTSTDTGNTDAETQPLVSSTRSPHSCTIARTLLRYTPHLLCGSKHDVSSVAFTTLPKYLSTICRQRRFHSLQSEDRKSRARSDDRHRTRC